MFGGAGTLLPEVELDPSSEVLGLVGGGVLLMLICAGVFVAAVVNQINNAGQGINFAELFVDTTPVEMPPVEVPAARLPSRSTATAPTVPHGPLESGLALALVFLSLSARCCASLAHTFWI